MTPVMGHPTLTMEGATRVPPTLCLPESSPRSGASCPPPRPLHRGAPCEATLCRGAPRLGRDIQGKTSLSCPPGPDCGYSQHDGPMATFTCRGRAGGNEGRRGRLYTQPLLPVCSNIGSSPLSPFP